MREQSGCLERPIKPNQILVPDTSGVQRRRFALGSGVGLPVRFEVIEGAFDIAHWLSYTEAG